MAEQALPKIRISSKKSGGSKKLGRNKKTALRYSNEGRKEKNKALRLARAKKREAKLNALNPHRAEDMAIRAAEKKSGLRKHQLTPKRRNPLKEGRKP